MRVPTTTAPGPVATSRSGTRQQGPVGAESNRNWTNNLGPSTTVFVMTHYPRPTIDFANGTSFHFVDGAPEEVLALAREAAGGKDVRIGGGPTTVREFLSVGLVDVMQVVLVPLVLGRGVSLWEGLEGLEDGYDVESIPSAPTGVMNLIFRRKA